MTNCCSQFYVDIDTTNNVLSFINAPGLPMEENLVQVLQVFDLTPTQTANVETYCTDVIAASLRLELFGCLLRPFSRKPKN